MTCAILIPWAETDWQAAGRLVSRTPMAINPHGHEQVARWVPLVAQFDPVAIHSSDKDPASQTAELLADGLALKARKSNGLLEVALGLWEGLTAGDLAKRFAKTYKQWKDDPSSVHPPEGERLPEALERLTLEIRKLAAKHRDGCFAVVLGPLSVAALRCRLEGKGYAALWDLVTDTPVRYEVDLHGDRAAMSAAGRSRSE